MALTHEDFARMFLNLRDLFAKNTTLYDYPIVKEKVLILNEHGNLLTQTIEKMDTSEATPKQLLALFTEEVTATGYALGMILEDVALKTNNKMMRLRVHNSYSMIQKMSKNDLVTCSKDLIKEARLHIDKLPLYKLTTALLDDFDETVSILDGQCQQKSEDTMQMRLHKIQLANIIKQCKDDVLGCDTFMESVRLKHPEIYRSYQTIRKVKSSIEIYSHVRVVDADTKELVPNALVRITTTTRTRNGKPIVVAKRKTKKLGEVRISNSEKDILLVEVQKIGYDMASAKMVIADDRPVNLTIQLKRLIIE